MPIIAQRIDRVENLLALFSQGLDGVGSRSVALLVKNNSTPIVIGPMLINGLQFNVYSNANHYTFANTQESGVWNGSSSLDQNSYLVTGTRSSVTLSRIVRVDVDISNRYLYSISNIQLPGVLPLLDFSSISNSQLRDEAKKNWDDFRIANTNLAVNSTVTTAKVLFETLLVYEFNATERNMDKLLSKLNQRLDTNETAKQFNFTRLDYHLMEKLRLLHQRTHPERAVRKNENIRPEMAYSIHQDVIQVLKSISLL